MANKFNFDIVLSNFKREELNLARKIAVAQKNYFLLAFKRQAWGNAQWKEVKRRIPGTDEYRYPKRKGLSRRRKDILIGRGVLRRAVNNSIKSVSARGIKFNIPLKYATIHNDGGIMKNGRRMPKRQYMGWNKELDTITKRIINNQVQNNFKTR